MSPILPTMQRRLAAGLLLTTALCALPSIALAQSTTWDGSEGSDWENGDNWSTGTVPTATANTGRPLVAIIAVDTDIVPTPIITDGQDVSVRNLTVGQGRDGIVDILSGGRLQIGDSGNFGTLDIGVSTNIFGVIDPSSGLVRVVGGDLDVFGPLSLGASFGSTGTLQVDNGGAVRADVLCLACGNANFAGTGLIDLNGSATLAITTGAGAVRIGESSGSGGTGTLRIRGGSRAEMAGDVGDVLGIGSAIEVSGDNGAGIASHLVWNGSLTAHGDITVTNGAHGEIGVLSNLTDTGSLTVSNGARLNQISGESGNWSFAQQADVLITGAGSLLNVNGALAINGGNIGAGSADFVIADGAVVNVAGSSSGLGFGDGRRLVVSNGAALNFQNGGLLVNAGHLLVENASVAMAGELSLGSVFGANRLSLFNADFSAGSIRGAGATTDGIDYIINIGGTANGPAGAVGTFDVGSINLAGSSASVAEMVLNHTGTDFDIGSVFAGSGTIRHLAGDTILSAVSSSFAGQTVVTGGTVTVDGVFGGFAAHRMNVSGGATLAGSGTIGGTVTLADATLAPGNSPGTLTITGNLVLGAATVLDWELGTPSVIGGGVNDLVDVSGNLTLDGTLGVTDVGGFGAGLYRLFNYGGTLTDNGLGIGAVPAGFAANDLTVQTSVANQVNLLVAAPGPSSFFFWDGPNTTANNAVDGGTDTWTATRGNWTIADGSANGPFDPAVLLIFAGTPGTVTVDDAAGAIAIRVGMQFAVNGYTVTGDSIGLDGATAIRVGDGTAAGTGTTTTIASALTGTGSLEKTDLGTLVLTGANSYSGGTTVSGGTLIGNSTSLQGNIVDNAALVFDQPAAGTYAGVISGTGSLAKAGAGTLTLTGANTYSGGTTVSAGTLVGDATSLQGNIADNAALVFDQATTGTYAGIISGTGSLTKAGSGTLTLTGANTYSGGTTVSAGTLIGNTTSLQGNIVDNAALVFDQASNATFAGVVSGTGSLSKSGAGALTLTGANTYSGGTTVSAGTLIGNTSSLQGDIVDNAALVFDQAAVGIYAGGISGTGTLSKQGAGTLTLTGTSTLAGAASVDAGTLLLTGALGGAVAVNSGATLGGTGTIGGRLDVNTSATLAPGNSIGTLTAGSAVFDPGSIYRVELNDGGNIAGVNNDLLRVTGAVVIDGGAVRASPANGTDDGRGYAPGTRYTIINAAGGVTGTFDSVIDDFAFLDFVDSYDANNVYLTSRLVRTTFCLAGSTFNQCSTGEGAFSLGSGAVFDALLVLSDVEAPIALDQLSGEIHASLEYAMVDDTRFPREAMLNRLIHVPAATEREGAWVEGFGSWGEWDGDGNAAELGRSIGGIFVGSDILAGAGFRLGAMGGHSHSNFDLPARATQASAETWHLGLYGARQWGRATLRLGGAYAWHDLEVVRAAVFTDFSDSLAASYGAQTGQMFGEAGYRLDFASGNIEPFAGIAYVHFDSDGYAERGGAAALVGGGQSLDNTWSTLGIRGETHLDLGGAPAAIEGSAAWRHAFDGAVPLTTHAFAGSDLFTVAGVPVAQDTLVLDLGFAAQVAPGASIGLRYNGQHGSGLTDHGVKATLGIAF